MAWEQDEDGVYRLNNEQQTQPAKLTPEELAARIEQVATTATNDEKAAADSLKVLYREPTRNRATIQQQEKEMDAARAKKEEALELKRQLNALGDPEKIAAIDKQLGEKSAEFQTLKGKPLQNRARMNQLVAEIEALMNQRDDILHPKQKQNGPKYQAGGYLR